MSWISVLVPYEAVPLPHDDEQDDTNENVRDDDKDGLEGLKSPEPDYPVRIPARYPRFGDRSTFEFI